MTTNQPHHLTNGGDKSADQTEQMTDDLPFFDPPGQPTDMAEGGGVSEAEDISSSDSLSENLSADEIAEAYADELQAAREHEFIEPDYDVPLTAVSPTSSPSINAPETNSLRPKPSLRPSLSETGASACHPSG